MSDANPNSLSERGELRGRQTTAEQSLSNESRIVAESLELVSRRNAELEMEVVALRKSRSSTLKRLRDADSARKKAEEAEGKQRQQAEDLAQAYATLESHIKERDQTAVELKKLSRAVEQSPISVVITDVAGTIEYVNPNFSRLTGYTPLEVIGKTPRLLSSGQTPKETITRLWKTILAGQEWRGELLNRKKNGELYWESLSISPITDAAGTITHFVCVKEDISKRKHVEVVLRNSETRHRALFDSSTDAIMLWNKSGLFDCNVATLRLFGLNDKKEFTSSHPSDLSPSKQPDGTDSHVAAEERIATALREGHAKFEWMHRRSDGEEFPAEVWLTAIDLDDERIIQATVRDISERKRAEKERADLNAQLVIMSRMSGMAEVATNVLHNVGNVLNSVNVSAGVIHETVRASEVSSLNKAVDIMEQHLGDLGAFVTHDNRGKHLPRFLIELSRQMATQESTILEQVNSLVHSIDHIKNIVATQQSYASGVSAIIEEVSLAELLEDAIRINAASMQRHSVHVIRQFEDVPKVSIDKQKLLQIIVNLIHNAKHACDDSGKELKQVTLSLRRTSEDRVLFEVRDNGVGIPAENLTRIFAHGFTTRKNGHGFGLHSAALAAEELDGSLTAFSDGPGTGAAFTLDLPSDKAAGVSRCKT